MADHTKIEWTDATWNPVTGCSVTSPGCTNCYAMKLAGTRLQHHPSRAGLTVPSKPGPKSKHVWTGEVRFNEQWLAQPLGWKRPRRIFVCAHGDLFHERVPDAWIDKVFAVMALSPQHQFQVLTKRSARMRDYCTMQAEGGGLIVDKIWRLVAPLPGGGYDTRLCKNDHARAVVKGMKGSPGNPSWFLPNVWLGVSVEDQARADERVPDLLATPAAVRWLSCEPLLGPVDLRWIAEPDEEKDGVIDALLGCNWVVAPGDDFRPVRPGHEGRKMGRWVVSGSEEIIANHKLDWIVCGGESGPGARPMHPDWARSLRDQCASAGIPFHFKQWGEYRPCENADFATTHEEATVLPDGRVRQWQPDYPRARLTSERMRPMLRVGKKAAGRLLDGVQHDGFPA